MIENNFYLSQQLAKALEARKLTLALAESCTGGGMAYQLTEIPGSSLWFDRGFVTYSNIAKIEMLGVDPKILDACGAVSAETAVEMAKCVLKHSNAEISLSITGVAGPGGGSVNKPVGTVFFGLAERRGFCESRFNLFTSGRHQIRVDSITFALKWLLEHISSVTGELK